MERELTVGLRLVSDTSGLDEVQRAVMYTGEVVSQAVDQMTSEAGQGIEGWGQDMLATVQDLGQALPQSLEASLDSASRQLSGVFGDTFSAMLQGQFDQIDSIWEGLWERLGGGFGNLLDRLLGGAFDQLGNWLGDGLGGLLDLFDGGLDDLFDGLFDFGGLNDLLGGLFDLGGGLGDLLDGLLGDKGPIAALFDSLGSIFSGDSYSPAEAQDEISRGINAIATVFKQIQEGGQSMTALDSQLNGVVEHMMLLAETAGMSKLEVAQLITALDPKLGQALLHLSTPLGGVEYALRQFLIDTQNYTDISQEAEQSLLAWARSLGISEDMVRDLVAQLRSGQISVSQFGNALSQGADNLDGIVKATTQFITTLDQLDGALERTSDGLVDLPASGPAAGPVDEPSSSPSPGLTVVAPILHSGGRLPLYAHSGLLVPRLFPDEVPLVARRGEFVVRAESVTPASLPWLQALNQGAAPLASGPSLTLQGPMVQIDGNFLGSEETLEELVRLVEGKLRDLAGRRYAA